MRPALFLDRDGVINVDRGYVHRPADFEFVDGIAELCSRFGARGYVSVVVTNQAGIGRGLYTEADFDALTKWMLDALTTRGVHIERVYHCPYHPEHGVGRYRRESQDRKPNPGMLLRARDELDLDLAASALVGDKVSDMEAAVRAGVGRPILLCPDAPPTGLPPHVEIVPSLRDIEP